MKSALLQNKIREAYIALDDAFVQAQNDSFNTCHVCKDTLRASKALNRCIVILDKIKKRNP